MNKKVIYKKMVNIFGVLNFIRKIEFELIMNKIKNKNENKVILDLACGNGEFMYIMKKKIKKTKLIGLDISKKSLDTAKIFGISNLILADASKLPFKNYSFDYIICNTSLQLFKEDIPVLFEMNRILKSRGKIYLTLDSFEHPKAKKIKPFHKKRENVYRYYTPDILQKKFSRTRFRIIHYEYYIKSIIGSLLFDLGIKMRWSIFWRFLGVFLYPLVLIGENISRDNKGYGLFVIGEKI